MNHDTEGTKNMKAFDQDDRSTWPKAWKHSVTLPDGKVVTRNSKTTNYSHAVIAESKVRVIGGMTSVTEDEWKWVAIRWSQNEANATKALNGFMTQAWYRNGRVVEVTQDWTN